jgi:hypothetical protein
VKIAPEIHGLIIAKSSPPDQPGQRWRRLCWCPLYIPNVRGNKQYRSYGNVFNVGQAAAFLFTCLASGHHGSAGEQYSPHFCGGFFMFYFEKTLIILYSDFHPGLRHDL